LTFCETDHTWALKPGDAKVKTSKSVKREKWHKKRYMALEHIMSKMGPD
jgi:hypothetical protein